MKQTNVITSISNYADEFGLPQAAAQSVRDNSLRVNLSSEATN